MSKQKASELIDMLKGSFEVGTKYAESDGRNNERFDYEHTIHNEACKEVADYIAELECRITEAETLLKSDLATQLPVTSSYHYLILRRILRVLDGGVTQ
jgi:hypothetical protein